MQAIMESIFDVGYLVTVIILGIRMIRRAPGPTTGKGRVGLLFGVMTVILGCGDAFHLVPRIAALWTDGFVTLAVPLGIGKLVTSITMTFFYVLLYRVWQMHYADAARGGSASGTGTAYPGGVLSPIIYILAAARIILCLFPQNQWIRTDAPLSWGIYRNIPFVILGLIIVVVFAVKGGAMKKAGRNDPFRFMWLAITLSFAFYIPVVLWADVYPLIGMLMLPKTCAYVWIVVMGYKGLR
ncbi:hypothetical protein FACS189483_00270 [Spirochaetia bacterium]|nr:hypothetical protein FACS189483_00270 [Spirochaetia bacterium]